MFDGRKPIIGVVHLLPLPGAPRYDGNFRDVLKRAMDDARALTEGGVDAVMVENFGDAPFFKDQVPAETIAFMTVAVQEIARTASVPLGVNVLRNDARAALAIAHAAGGRFIRVNVHTGAMVTDQGIIEGKAADTLRVRKALQADSGPERIQIFADVLVKHAFPLGSSTLLQTARDTSERGLADALILTGSATGEPCDLNEVFQVKDQLANAIVLVGSGITAENVQQCLSVCDGVIVGTRLKRDGMIANPVDVRRVRRLVKVAKG